MISSLCVGSFFEAGVFAPESSAVSWRRLASGHAASTADVRGHESSAIYVQELLCRSAVQRDLRGLSFLRVEDRENHVVARIAPSTNRSIRRSNGVGDGSATRKVVFDDPASYGFRITLWRGAHAGLRDSRCGNERSTETNDCDRTAIGEFHDLRLLSAGMVATDTASR